MTRRLVGSVISAAVLMAGHALAETPGSGGDFTFRRIGLPQAGQGRLITVQIAPRAAPAVPPVPDMPAPGADPGAGGGAPSGYDWFWLAVSPRLSDTGPGRLGIALNEMNSAAEGQGVAAPRLQLMQSIAQTYGRDILRATVGTQVSPALVLAVIAVESAGQSDAVSRAGAQGLMQLMPDTAARFGVADSLVATDNIGGGVAYLDWLMEHFRRDPILVLAGYNAGEGSIRDYDGVPPFEETRAYVPKVLAAWNVARALCITPPELMTDGCVFSATGG